MTADTTLYEEDFQPQPAAPDDLINGDAATRQEARREAMQRDRERAQESHTAKVEAFTEEPKRSKRAREYENKVADVLRFVMRMTISSPNTVADAAAIITYADQVAEKAGDLADADPRVAKAIDFINGGTESEALNLVMVTLPLVLQVIRNHEPDGPVVETAKEFKLFGRWTIRIPFAIRIKNRFFRNLTAEPAHLYATTFVPEVTAALKAQGIDVPAYKG